MANLRYLIQGDSPPNCGVRGPLVLNGSKYWISADFKLKDIPALLSDVGELVHLQDPRARFDTRGNFYVKDGTRTKKRIPGTPSAEGIIDELRSLGYNIPQGYWNGSSGRIMEKVNSRRTLV
jgi:hypothetical protein